MSEKDIKETIAQFDKNGDGTVDGRAHVISRRAYNLHTDQFADQALKLKDRLVFAMVGIGAASIGS